MFARTIFVDATSLMRLYVGLISYEQTFSLDAHFAWVVT